LQLAEAVCLAAALGEGEGVIGVQPIIKPHEQYQYISGCNLKSELGKMFGTYLMENVNNNKGFR
jgi:ApaG protein